MGRDKLSLEVGGVPLIRRVHDVLASRCDEVAAAVGVDYAPGMENVRRVSDLRPGRGPLAGMEAGMEAASYPLIFVVAGDMPFVPGDLIEFLLGRVAAGASAAVPMRRGRRHPLCAAYDRRILPVVSSALDEGIGAVRVLLEILDGVEYVDEDLRRFGDPDVFLMNVNSPEDLERARSASRGGRA